jgi:uncharacterized membrane protein
MTRLLQRPRVAVTAVAVLAFVVECLFIRGGLLSHERFGDVGLYASDAHRMLEGQVPYRDFFFEYPPGALAPIIAPALISTAHYTLLFKILATVLGAATLCVAAGVSASAGLSLRRTALALGSMALAPLLLGPLLLDEYDLWPALITCLALLVVLRGRDRFGAGLLGLGAATKVFPVVIVPAAVVWVYKRSGRRPALRFLTIAIAVAAALYLVFAALGPGGVWYSLEIQARRGLQKESLGSALLYVLDQLGLYKAHIAVGNAQWTELGGPSGAALATLGSLCQAAVAVGVAALAARRRPEPRTLLYAAAAAVAGFVAFGKVFSPQYLIWLVPLVALAGGLAENVMLAAALVLTQLWFLRIVTPFDLDGEIWLVVARDVLVVGVFALLVARLRRLPLAEPLRELRTTRRGADSVRAGPM